MVESIFQLLEVVRTPYCVEDDFRELRVQLYMRLRDHLMDKDTYDILYKEVQELEDAYKGRQK